MESPEHIREAYSILAKEYSLPKWDILNKEFELLYIEPILEVSNPLSLVANRIENRLSGIVNYLHSILNPPQNNMILIKEHSFLNEGDKKQIINLMTKIIASFVNHKIICDKSDKVLADIIKLRWDTWKKIKKPYSEIVKRVEEGWKKASKH